jgi:8-oxo-dGTP pyrophosphatase MutT (NUDIX family)
MKDNNLKSGVLLTTPYFDVIDIDGHVGVKSTVDSVIILPFVSDENGLPLMLGVLDEINRFRDGGKCLSLISGRCDDEDSNFLDTAKRELKEESGFDIDDDKKWYFLGTITASKFVDCEYPCFAVDVTGIEAGKKTTDGSEDEKNSRFIFIPANDVVKSKDVFIPALFLKLFKYVVGMDLYDREDSVFSKKSGFKGEI